MPHHRNVIHLRQTENGLERTHAQLEHYHADRIGEKPHLRVDYRHLHLNHKIDITKLDLRKIANANANPRSLAALWRALKSLKTRLSHRLLSLLIWRRT